MVMKFSTLIMAIILTGVIVSGYMYFISDYSRAFGVTPDVAYNASFNKMTEGLTIANDITQSTQPGNGTSSMDIVTKLQTVMFGGLFKAANVGGVMYDVLIDTQNMLGLPPFFVQGIIGCLLVCLGFILVQLVWRPFIPL